MITRPLVVLGTGRIARAFLRQLMGQREALKTRFSLDLPVAAVSNSRVLRTGSPFLDDEALEAIVSRGLATGEGDTIKGSSAAWQMRYVADLGPEGLPNAVVLDLTAADAMAPILLSAMDGGADVVLANKKPLCDSYETFEKLVVHPRGRIGYEATVGAGLPIVAPLRALHETGDRLIDATACLSGTLGFLCTALEDGQLLSSIVKQAFERGFTEPDPRDDLSGADVRRKALILARTFGLPFESAVVPTAPVLPLDDSPLDVWMAGLTRHDALLKARADAAQEQGSVLRYIARVAPDGCEVGLKEIPRNTAIGRLRGTDNIITVRTHYYDERPLIIAGPGAGANVTAAGVFGDVLRLSGVA